MYFTLYADGGSRGNPGPAGAGSFVRDEEGVQVVTVSEYLGITTNNIAEYTALLRALEELRTLLGEASGEAVVDARLDSQLVVRQMNGEYKIKHPNIIPLASRVKEVVRAFKTVSFTHVYREDNKEADALANEAMDRGH
ncbi:MAG: ribonuclease HI family protein [Candidatus Pacebacteria bacterium]|nr:ribonuclease HI family protein [Candidatus Paceibacterota bacterium]